jgi:probable HAF family extracellular repeat protein
MQSQSRGGRACSSTWEKHVRNVASLVCLLCAAGAAHRAGAQEQEAPWCQPLFCGVGDLRGGSMGWYSWTFGISGDGRTVVGESASEFAGPGMFEAFRWTRTEGIVGIARHFGRESRAYAASYDGSVIVGYTDTLEGRAAFRWTAETGMVLLSPPAGGYRIPSAAATGVSADGTVVVGWARKTKSRDEAFRWTAQSGASVWLGKLEGAKSSGANAVSADGTVIVGTCYFDVWDSEAVRWKDGEIIGLGKFPGADVSHANAVSADGRVIVGYCTSEDPNGPAGGWYWTEETGMVDIGYIEGKSTGSGANAVNHDGSLIFGATGGLGETFAYVWDREHGMRDLREILREHGTYLDHWEELPSVDACSYDGLSVAGHGIHRHFGQEGWYALLPQPAVMR